MSDEATINPDGSTTFEGAPPSGVPAADSDVPMGTEEEVLKEAAPQGIDPAIYVLLGLVVVVVLYLLAFRKKTQSDDFFSNLDGDKVCDS